jgi:hypothetical protein
LTIVRILIGTIRIAGAWRAVRAQAVGLAHGVANAILVIAGITWLPDIAWVGARSLDADILAGGVVAARLAVRLGTLLTGRRAASIAEEGAGGVELTAEPVRRKAGVPPSRHLAATVARLQRAGLALSGAFPGPEKGTRAERTAELVQEPAAAAAARHRTAAVARLGRRAWLAGLRAGLVAEERAFAARTEEHLLYRTDAPPTRYRTATVPLDNGDGLGRDATG